MLDEQLYDTMTFEVKKIARVLNGLFLSREEEALYIKYTTTNKNVIFGCDMYKAAVGCDYCEVL